MSNKTKGEQLEEQLLGQKYLEHWCPMVIDVLKEHQDRIDYLEEKIDELLKRGEKP
jgi:hypothetical protein